MTDAQGALLAFIILTLAIAGTRLWPLVQWRMRERRYRLEAERFKREPRVGDKAGYRLDEHGTYVVGEVTRIVGGPISYLSGAYTVELTATRITSMGAVVRVDVWNCRNLRYFPPDTPVGTTQVTETLR